MVERADAARNRRAILDATEELLATDHPAHLSLDRVAARAGVGKGTVFRRFGSRTGLFEELLAERAASIGQQIDSDAAPLGRQASTRERLVGFLDALCELAGHNLALIAAHEQACATDKQRDPTYRRWHHHLAVLVSEIRPELDAQFIAHVLLGAFDGELVRETIDHGGLKRLKSSVRQLVGTLVG
jgi:AcrR family transcriptional regulator